MPKPHEQIIFEKTLRSANKSPSTPLIKSKIQKCVNIISPFLHFLHQKSSSQSIDLSLNSPKSPLLQTPKQQLSLFSKRTNIFNFVSQGTGDYDNVTPNIKTADLKGEMNDFFDEKIFKYYATRTLEEGYGFGEIPFNNDRARTFTTLCSEDCWLGVMDRKDYLQIFREIQKIKIQEKIDFFSKTFFLNALEKETWKIYNYSFLFQKFKVKRGVEIYSKGEPVNQIFLVKKGEIELYEQNYSEFYRIKVALLSKGQIFGEEQLLDLEDRRFSALCSSQQATLFSLNKSFLQQIFSDNCDFQNIFKKIMQKKASFREAKIQTIIDIKKPSKNQYIKNNDPKFFSYRATEEDIDRFIQQAPVDTKVSDISSPLNTVESEIKVRVKAFEDKTKKSCFLRGKRMYTKKQKNNNKNSHNGSIYEIDDSEKRLKDRGEDTNYLKEIIRNNQKCYRVLDQRSKKMTRDEILQIFDKEKLEILENRKRLQRKYGDKSKEVENNKESDKSNMKCNYTQLFDEVLQSHKRKKTNLRSKSATNFNRGSLNGGINSLAKYDNKGEQKINFHIKLVNSAKSRPVSARPVSGGYIIGKNFNFKINEEKKNNSQGNFLGVYERIQDFLIRGKSSALFSKNSSLKRR